MPVTDLVIEAKPRWSGTIGAGGVAESTTTTIPLSSAANLDDGDIYIFTVNRVTSDGTKNNLSEMETVIGELSGTSFINCVRGLEGTAQAWDAGTVVEILFTAAHWNKLKEAWETEHSQDGTHSAVTATTITTTGAVDAKTLKINAGTAMTAVLDEDTMSSDSATALATQQSIKAYVDTDGGSLGGWIDANETWTYASTNTFTISGDFTSLLKPGTKLKLTQPTNGLRYYYVITSTESDGLTTVSVDGGSYANAGLDNEVITNPYYSTSGKPAGFPADWGFNYVYYQTGVTTTHNYSSLGSSEQQVNDGSNNWEVIITLPEASDVEIFWDLNYSVSNQYGADIYLSRDLGEISEESVSIANATTRNWQAITSNNISIRVVDTAVPAGTHTYTLTVKASGSTVVVVNYYNRCLFAKAIGKV